MKITLGKNFPLELEKLVDTRLLIQANSGGGKSWAIRKLLEETHGKVQHIVLDIEGEFGTLREKFDYILAGKDGDVSLIAYKNDAISLLAHKTLELRADLICDLYELKQHERIKFVRTFLESLINAPKALWHPVLVVVDEAHIFCPEKGHAESSGAVIDLCTRGRKRGFCGVLATQRLSKLHKDAAAECNNKLIGRTGLDIDVKRALDELGLSSKEYTTLRTLEPGEFFAYGPALSKTVEKVAIGSVETTHPKAGQRNISHKPEPTARILKVLEKLSDLPKEAESEAKTKEELQAQIKELKKQLRFSTMNTQAAVDPKKELERINKAIEATQKVIREDLQKQTKAFIRSTLKDLKEAIDKGMPGDIEFVQTKIMPAQTRPAEPSIVVGYNFNKKPAPTKPRFEHIKYYEESDKVTAELYDTLGKCERAILGFLHAKYKDCAEGVVIGFTKMQIGAMTGYAYKSGNFNNCMGKLLRIGAIEKSGEYYRIQKLWYQAHTFDDVPHRLEDWVQKLGKCERAIYSFLLENPNQTYTKEEVGEATGYTAQSGNFSNCIYRLNTLGLIQKQGSSLSLNPDLTTLESGAA